MNLKISLNYFREGLGTCLRSRGIEPKPVDLIKVTISSSVFVNHLDPILAKLL